MMTKIFEWPIGSFGYRDSTPVHRLLGGIMYIDSIAGVIDCVTLDQSEIEGTIDPEAKKHFTEYFQTA